jgi:hypothetical protein
MIQFMGQLFHRIAEEPPLRIVSQKIVKYFSFSLWQKVRWEAVDRPQYLLGLLKAAEQASSQGIQEIAAIEFGVASGNGLLYLDMYAEKIEKETGIKVLLYGFDSGSGLPTPLPDFRDHPDQWRSHDYPMDEQNLRKRLSERVTLLIGNVKDTVPKFLSQNTIPIGFISFDLDLYSSTIDAMKVLSSTNRKVLNRIILYFDDIDFFFNHQFAGELLAISEFNQNNVHIKIDKWRGIQRNQVFKDSLWLSKMYVAHNLESISSIHLNRPPAKYVV